MELADEGIKVLASAGLGKSTTLVIALTGPPTCPELDDLLAGIYRDRKTVWSVDRIT